MEPPATSSSRTWLSVKVLGKMSKSQVISQHLVWVPDLQWNHKLAFLLEYWILLICFCGTRELIKNKYCKSLLPLVTLYHPRETQRTKRQTVSIRSRANACVYSSALASKVDIVHEGRQPLTKLLHLQTCKGLMRSVGSVTGKQREEE